MTEADRILLSAPHGWNFCLWEWDPRDPESVPRQYFAWDRDHFSRMFCGMSRNQFLLALGVPRSHLGRRSGAQQGRRRRAPKKTRRRA